MGDRFQHKYSKYESLLFVERDAEPSFTASHIEGFLDHVWNGFLELMTQDVSKKIVETWFRSLKIKQWDSINKHVFIQTPNSFVKDWLYKNYYDPCVKNFSRIFGEQTVKVSFVHEENFTSSILVKPAQLVTENVVGKKNFLKKVSTRTCIQNKNYTFENFIIGVNNDFAFNAAKMVIESKSPLYNPLFIHGSCGTGKTHLLHAIANEITRKNPDKRVSYQTVDSFMQDFVSSVKTNTVRKFQESFQDIDVLLFDDIQMLVKKESIQEILCKIFTIMQENAKQIILACDTAPRFLKGISRRMQSRLENGLIVDMQEPTFETVVEIIENKSRVLNLIIDRGIICHLAHYAQSSIRKAEGALIRLLAYQSLSRQNVSFELVQNIFPLEITFSNDSTEVLPIVNAVCSNYRISLTQVRSKSKKRFITDAKHICIYLIRKYTNKSYRDIAHFFKLTDHTSVIYAHKKMQEKIKVTLQLQKKISEIEMEIAQKRVRQ